jgi:predicted RNase H-like HicB family nuclease
VALGVCRELNRKRQGAGALQDASRFSGIALNSRLVFHRISGDTPAMEIVFTVTQENDGGYVAECLSHDIFTQGNTWEELRANVREAVSAYFFDQPKPAAVRLHLVRDELLAGA